MKKTLLAVGALLVLGLAFSFADNPHTPRAPIVVAQQTINGQVGSSASTTLFTPASEGTFRFSLYITSASCAAPTGATSLGLMWNDGLDPRTQYSPPPQCNGIGYAMSPVEYTLVIHGAANQPISFSIVASDQTDAFTYYLTLEEL